MHMQQSSANKPDKQQASPIAYHSEQLFRGRRHVTIEHEGEVYQLRVTRNGKLILTK